MVWDCDALSASKPVIMQFMDESEAQQIEKNDIKSFRDSPVYPLMPRLKKGLLHCTSIEGYKGIHQDGNIRPNTGQFPYSYPQSASYYGSNGYICLFDFEFVQEKDYRKNYDFWEDFIYSRNKPKIILRLNRKTLKKNLIPNSAAPKSGEKGYKPKIPFVEAWYPKDIPISAINSYIFTLWNSELGKKGEIEFYEYSNKNLQEFEKAILKF
jgi:hypothetical protein